MIAYKPTYFFFAWVLANMIIMGCVKPDNSTFMENEIVVQGILVAGDNFQKIKINDLNTGKEINDASVQICLHQECYELNLVEPGIYQSSPELIIYPDSIYQLKINWHEKTIRSDAHIPKPITWVNVEDLVIAIDAGNPGQQVFAAEWLAEGDLSFILSLKNIEPDPLEIDYPTAPFSFGNTYQLPIQNSNIMLQDLFFTHYGAHEFSVYALEEKYQNLFFYQPQIQQIQPREALDNIDGARGVFVGVSKLKVNIMVN